MLFDSTISSSFLIIPGLATACLNCTSDLPDPIFDASMVWSFYWKKPANHQYEDIWLSTILPTGKALILGNTGYVVSKNANLLPVETVKRGQRPALYLINLFQTVFISVHFNKR